MKTDSIVLNEDMFYCVGLLWLKGCPIDLQLKVPVSIQVKGKLGKYTLDRDALYSRAP